MGLPFIGRSSATQGSQRQQAQEMAVPVGVMGFKGATSFHDDSPVFRRPVHAVAAVDISHRWVLGQLLQLCSLATPTSQQRKMAH